MTLGNQYIPVTQQGYIGHDSGKGYTPCIDSKPYKEDGSV